MQGQTTQQLTDLSQVPSERDWVIDVPRNFQAMPSMEDPQAAMNLSFKKRALGSLVILGALSAFLTAGPFPPFHTPPPPPRNPFSTPTPPPGTPNHPPAPPR